MKINDLICNEEDNLHCFQCCYRMALNYLANRRVSLFESELETGFVAGKQSWPHAGILSFLAQSFNVRLIENFDFVSFADDPYKYLEAHVNNKEIFESVLETSDLNKEKKLVAEMIANNNCIIETRAPSLADIALHNKEDAIIIVNVNYWRLLNKEGYDGHFVIIEDISDKEITLQNPGLPPIASQVVDIEDFLAAWKNDEGADFSNLLIISKS